MESVPVLPRALKKALQKLDADIFCLQGDQMSEKPGEAGASRLLSILELREPQRGYSGTAVFTKKEPLSVTYGLGIEEHDKEGRVITAEMDDFYLVTVYTPNSPVRASKTGIPHGMGKRFPGLSSEASGEKACDLLWRHECGTSGKLTSKNPKTNRMNAGFTDEERACFTRTLEAGFIGYISLLLSGA